MTSAPTPSIIDTRRDQMFPTLEPSEIERVRRFGKQHAFAPGEPLAKVGERGVGLSIILSGQVEVIRYDSARRSSPMDPARSWANWRNSPAGRRWSMLRVDRSRR